MEIYFCCGVSEIIFFWKLIKVVLFYVNNFIKILKFWQIISIPIDYLKIIIDAYQILFHVNIALLMHVFIKIK